MLALGPKTRESPQIIVSRILMFMWPLASLTGGMQAPGENCALGFCDFLRANRV